MLDLYFDRILHLLDMFNIIFSFAHVLAVGHSSKVMNTKIRVRMLSCLSVIFVLFGILTDADLMETKCPLSPAISLERRQVLDTLENNTIGG